MTPEDVKTCNTLHETAMSKVDHALAVVNASGYDSDGVKFFAEAFRLEAQATQMLLDAGPDESRDLSLRVLCRSTARLALDAHLPQDAADWARRGIDAHHPDPDHISGIVRRIQEELQEALEDALKAGAT